jgi:hypothetical protein
MPKMYKTWSIIIVIFIVILRYVKANAVKKTITYNFYSRFAYMVLLSRGYTVLSCLWRRGSVSPCKPCTAFPRSMNIKVTKIQQIGINTRYISSISTSCSNILQQCIAVVYCCCIVLQYTEPYLHRMPLYFCSIVSSITSGMHKFITNLEATSKF